MEFFCARRPGLAIAEGETDKSERCPVPRVASETSALLHPLHHNAGARHRTPVGGSGDAASPFALLVDATDAPPPKEPASRTPTSSKASSQTPDQSSPTPASPDQSNDGTSEATSNASQANTEPQAADGSESDANDRKRPEDAASADLLDSLMAGTAGDGTVPQPVPTPPAAIVNVSVDVVLVAQGAPNGESTAAAGITAPSAADPTAQSAGPGTVLPASQATAGNQAATTEQTAPTSAAGADNAALAVNGDTADEPDQQQATQGSNDPAPKETGKPAPEQAAAKPVITAQSQPTDTPPDAAVVTTSNHPTPPAGPSSAAARKGDTEAGKSEGTADAEDAGSKPRAATDPTQPAPADRAPRGLHRAHADAPATDDKERPLVASELRDAAHDAKLPTDAVQGALLANDQAAAASAQPAAASASQSSEPAVPIAGLAVEIAARAQSGQNRFEIRLDPPELGRIDVRLDIDRSGQVTSRLIVDRPETLDQLRRDSAGLERALQDAGLKTAQNGLQFSLRDQGFAGRDNNSSSSDAARLVVPDPDLAPVEMPANVYGRMLRTSGIDIRV
jgi:flagellar hook-length control protein FliK